MLQEERNVRGVLPGAWACDLGVRDGRRLGGLHPGLPCTLVSGPRGRRSKHTSRQFDTFIHMPFKSARTLGNRTIWMSALLLSLSANGSSQDLTVHDPGVRGGN